MAHEVVRRVADEGAYSNRLLPVLLDRSGLEQRDRALATELGLLVDRPLAKASPPTPRWGRRVAWSEAELRMLLPEDQVEEAATPLGQRGR